MISSALAQSGGRTTSRLVTLMPPSQQWTSLHGAACWSTVQAPAGSKQMNHALPVNTIRVPIPCSSPRTFQLLVLALPAAAVGISQCAQLLDLLLQVCCLSLIGIRRVGRHGRVTHTTSAAEAEPHNCRPLLITSLSSWM